ncbi:hypothetical protein [Streptomyces sp. NPDC048442]|uniref:hypothetical protein n=1 Tax=Streptomyces sp. NPDC048442 TaxID=3154823 RepID=UPI0034245452
MTPTPVSISTFTPRRRTIAAAALAALAVLALTGCGSEPSAGAAAKEPAKGVVAKASPVQPSPEQKAFAAMLDGFAKMCPVADGVAPTPPGEFAPPGAPQTLPPGETPPPGEVHPPRPTGPEAELDSHEWCTSVHHEQRIIEALQKVAEPTPATVRTTLNSLGYIDEHIHGLKQDGKTTRFHLDLRENGSRHCETGRASGATTEVDACVALPTGPFIIKTAAQP